MRATAKICGDRGSGGTDGARKPQLRLSANPGSAVQSGAWVGRGTIAEILARHGIEPAPERERKASWKEFLTQHWDLIVAADFFTIEACTRRGLQRFFILFFMELSTRKVEIAGIASSASSLWMNQIGRNLTDAVDGLLKGKCYLIHDRDPLFTAEFLRLLKEVGVASVQLPPRSPNLNAQAERFVRTIKESCLERMILFGERSMRRATAEFMAHYHSARNHQGLDNALICPRAWACEWRSRSASAGTSRRAAELLLPQGCLRITPTFDRGPWCPMYRCVVPELATTPVGAAGGPMERGIDRQIDNPKWIHLHIDRTAQTHFRTGQDRTIDFSDTTGGLEPPTFGL
jgi:transposase InsO family protein